MVVDNISNCGRYYVFGERFIKAFEFLKTNDIRKMELGRHEIDGDDIFILVQEYMSKSIDECAMESHRKYADIQYIVEGYENMGYAPVSRCKLTVPYDSKKDIQFYEKECQSILLRQGDFALIFPEDGHMPQRLASVSTLVRKACVKVRVD